MAWAVRASVKAVLGRARHVGASLALDESLDETPSRVRLNLEMEAAVVGTVDINTDRILQGVRVDVHLSNDSGLGPGREDGGGS